MAKTSSPFVRATLAMLLLLAAAACNTVSGAGKDVQALGRVVTHSADHVKHDVSH